VTAVAAPALASSLARVAAAVPWCSFRLGLPPGEVIVDAADPVALGGGHWIRCADALTAPGFFTRWSQLVSTRMAETYSTVPPVTPAGYVMGWYVGMFGQLGGMLFHQARRVPSLSPHNLAFTVNPTHLRPVGVALLDGAFACLPGDRDAASTQATPLPDAATLAAVLRAEAAGHGGRFVEAYRHASRFGPHTLWGAVTDALDRGVWHLAHERNDDAAGAADAALVLPGRVGPFTSGSTIHTLRGASGTVHWTRTRQSCCFYYKLPGVDTPCSTCPRLTDPQRARLLDADN